MKKGDIVVSVSENERFIIKTIEGQKSDFEKMKEAGKMQGVFSRTMGEPEEKSFVAITIDEAMIIVREQLEQLEK